MPDTTSAAGHVGTLWTWPQSHIVVVDVNPSYIVVEAFGPDVMTLFSNIGTWTSLSTISTQLLRPWQRPPPPQEVDGAQPVVVQNSAGSTPSKRHFQGHFKAPRWVTGWPREVLTSYGKFDESPGLDPLTRLPL